ncbi:MAG: hypothetical protein ACRD2C_16500 [Acidimicrobiales bacterium]
MTAAPAAVVRADVRGAARRWLRHGLVRQVPAAPLAGLDAAARRGFLASVVDEALVWVTSPTPSGSVTGDVVVVPKAPHVTTSRGLAAMIARMLAFGVEVRGVHVADRPAVDVAAALYPATARYYAERPPETSALWKALLDRFAVDAFEAVFGEPFDRKMVVPAREVIEEGGLDEATLAAIWQEGRLPLKCTDLTARYGGQATCRALVEAPGRPWLKQTLGHTALHHKVTRASLGRPPEHIWFHCALPLGIQRIGSGLVAFALKHERITNGRPRVILNGHFLGLAGLFADQTRVVDVALSPTARLADLRRWVIGSHIRPQLCQPGSIRYDAQRDRFPVDRPGGVNPQANVVHCSDGLLAAARERAALVGTSPAGVLVDRLRARGLIDDELTHIVLADPLVGPPDALRHLTDLTQGQGLEECVATVLHHLPPVFGERNGHATGVRVATFADRVAGFVGAGGDVGRYPDVVERRRPPSSAVPWVADLGAEPGTGVGPGVEARGREMLAAGGVGLVVPAGGTGGRFGGRGLSEDDPRRHKPLAPVFRVAGVARCALDVRLANALYWRGEAGGDLPVAVMGAATNAAAIGRWCEAWHARGVDGLDCFRQHGVYRFTAAGVGDLVARGGSDGRSGRSGRPVRWIDHVLRGQDGAPSLKPFGALGCLTAFALDGLYEGWRKAGVEVLVVSSADDAAFRLDPRVLGYMVGHSLDAVVVGVPQGLRASVTGDDGDGCTTEIRGDASGWCVDAVGRPCTLEGRGDGTAWVRRDGLLLGAAAPTIDVGGVISEAERAGVGRWGLAVVEGLDPTEALEIGSLFSANQLYLRCRALDPFLARGPDGVADLVDALPTFAEHKTVDGVEAVQLVQPVAGILRVLDRVGAVGMHRSPVEGQRGGYGAIKERADIPFTQHMLDVLATRGDDLLLPDARLR